MQASSPGWPSRPNGVWPPNFLSFSGYAPPETCSGVQTGPGATPFTRIPLLANCLASDFTKLVVAAFVWASLNLLQFVVLRLSPPPPLIATSIQLPGGTG